MHHATLYPLKHDSDDILNVDFCSQIDVNIKFLMLP